MSKPQRKLSYVCDRCGLLLGQEHELFLQAAGTFYCGACDAETGVHDDNESPSPHEHREARAWEVFLAIIEHRHAGKWPETRLLVGKEAARDAFAYVYAFDEVAEEENKLGLPCDETVEEKRSRVASKATK